jgi:hypothetical protein
MLMAGRAEGGYTPLYLKPLRVPLATLRSPSEPEQNRRKLLETVDFLIKDAEETIADLKRIGGDKQLIKDYEEELTKLREQRKKLMGKGK